MSDLLNEFKIFSKISDDLKKSIKYFHVFNGGLSVLFVTIDDRVYGFGWNSKGMLGFANENKDKNKGEFEIIELRNQGIIQFHIGVDFVIALSINNKLFSWGRNDRGQLGRGYASEEISRPSSIEMFDNVIIKQIDSYWTTIAILTDDRKVYVWGNNENKQCDDNERYVSKPIEKIFPNGVIIESIFLSHKKSFAISNNGNVYIWGIYHYRKKFLFHEPSKPRLINSIKNVKSIGFIQFKTFFLLNDHKIYISHIFDSFEEVNCSGYVIDKIIRYKPQFYENSNYLLIDNNNGVYNISFHDKNLWLMEKSIFDFFAKEHDTFETIELKTIINRKEDIGHGQFGRVFKCIRYGKEYAIKKMDMFRLKKDLMDKNSEINIMWKLSSEYIANLYDYWIEKTNDGDEFLYMQIEICNYNMNDFFAKICECKNLPDDIIITIEIEVMKQMFESVNHLHLNKVIHRDLKPCNILIKLNSSNERFIKLCDFGLSVNHDLSSMTHSSDVGSNKYKAPEVKHGGKYTEKADIFSLGVMMCKDFKLLSMMEVNLHGYLKEIETLKNLFLKENPNERPHWNTILDVFKTSNFTKSIMMSRSILQIFLRNESNNYPVDIIKILNIINNHYEHLVASID